MATELDYDAIDAMEAESNGGSVLTYEEEYADELQKEEVQEVDNTDDNDSESLDTTSTEDLSDSDNAPQDETPSVQEVETYALRADGVDLNLNLDELKQFASKGMNYTKKMQAIKPYSRMVSAISENGLTEDDINTLIDIKKGNKSALAKIVKDSGADVYDLPNEDEVEQYSPNKYGKSIQEQEFNDVVSNLQQDSQVFSITQQVYQNLDNQSKEFLYNNPQALSGLQYDIKNGVFNRVFPEVQKMAMKDDYRRPILEYYMQIGPSIVSSMQKEQQDNQRQKELINANRQAQKAKAVVPNRNTSPKNYIDDLMDDVDEEDFAKWKALVSARNY